MKSRIAMVASVLAMALVGSACGPAGEAYLGAMATARSEAIATVRAEGTGVTHKVTGNMLVKYEVTGDANGVTITLLNETGGISQGNYVLPFKNLVAFPVDTPILSISARIIDPTHGVPSITCRIIATTMFAGLMTGADPVGLLAEAKAVGPGNTAVCLWQNADN